LLHRNPRPLAKKVTGQQEPPGHQRHGRNCSYLPEIAAVPYASPLRHELPLLWQPICRMKEDTVDTWHA